MDLASLMTSPLATSRKSSHFLRLILAEAASYGMPPAVVVVLDDLAAMLGLYNPIPENTAEHISGPVISWRTHPSQPGFERINEVERLLYKQRCLLAFGGGRPGQMVGTAEIVCALGNIVQGMSPPDYYEIFTWASLDVLATITGDTSEKILADPGKKHWKKIEDDEVLKPGGRLHATYQTIATSIRRESIAAMKSSDEHPRKYLLPFAKIFIEGNVQAMMDAEEAGDQRMIAAIADSTRIILGMFPDLEEFATSLNVEQEQITIE